MQPQAVLLEARPVVLLLSGHNYPGKVYRVLMKKHQQGVLQSPGLIRYP